MLLVLIVFDTIIVNKLIIHTHARMHARTHTHTHI